MKRMKTPLALLLAGLMTVTPVTAQINLPDLGDSAVAGFSSRDESRAGREGVVWLRAQEAMLGDAELDDYLNRLSRRLATASPDPAQHYTLFAIDDGQINAFAMPGGYIGVHTGLLLAAQTESELASVIGHEMAHVSQRHIARQLEQQGMNQLLAIGGILAAVLMASAGGGADAALAAAQVGPGMAMQKQLAYSRDFEREADRVGMQTLTRAGFDPRAMAAFFDRMQKVNRASNNNALAFLRTHPVTSERMSEAQGRALSLPSRMPADSTEFLLAREKARLSRLDPQAAISFYTDALKDGRYLSEMAQWYGLAGAQLKRNDLAAARTSAARARALAPAPHPWLVSLDAAIAAAGGDYATSARLYREGRQRFPDAPALAYGELDSLIAAGQTDAARQLAETAVSRRPEDPELWARLARIYADRDKLRYHFALGQQLYYQQEARPALEQFQLAREAPGDDFYLRSRLDARIRELMPVVKEQIEAQRQRR